MILVGLTGSIGMGKSTTGRMFAEAGIPVYDSDAEVAALYAAGGEAVKAVEAAFPGVVRGGAVDRDLLAQRVLKAPSAMEKLTGEIVYPMLARRRSAFLKAAEEAGADMVVLDVPLLFETGAHRTVDAVVVVTAPSEVQRTRVLARPGMSPEKFEAILARQMPDAEKRAGADYIVDTSKGMEAARRQVAEIIAALRARPVEGVREPGH